MLLDSVRQGGRAAFRQRLREELASTPTLSPTAEHLGAASSAADFVYFVSTPDVRSGADHSTPNRSQTGGLRNIATDVSFVLVDWWEY